MTGKREWGDFQTPVDFAEAVCKLLQQKRHIQPEVVIEPTCGIGNFLKSSLCFDAERYLGIEINAEYCEICRAQLQDTRVEIINDNIFNCSFSDKRQDNTLIIGNPPWVTNSTLSALASENLPQKQNFKGLKGIEAITGASNFDICEYIILKLINDFSNTDSVVAMLCKSSVARNIFQELKRQKINFLSYEVFEFDAKTVFGISASSCLLVLKLTKQNSSPEFGYAYDINNIEQAKYTFGYRGGSFYSHLEAESEDFEGSCCFEWRQGVKHDCSRVMELSCVGEGLQNGLKEKVELEDALLFPLIKSSMFKRPVINAFSKYVLVTQKKVKQDTQYIKTDYPKTWAYLEKYKDKFAGRKSSIYRGAPPFSMFGIGDYSFAQYKVGLSGFYKEPLFSVLYSEDGKPVMTDDTAYFICLPTYAMAYVAMLYLNSAKVRNFLLTIAFLDAKRPYTKKVLARIDFKKVISKVTFEDLQDTEQALGLDKYVTQAMINKFMLLPELQQQEHFS